MNKRIKKITYTLERPCGLTLIELLIALAITGLISIALAMFLTQSMDVWVEGEKKSDIVNESKGAMDIITRELKHAIKWDNMEAETSSVKFKVDLYGDGESEIVEFKIDPTDSTKLQRIEQGTEDDGTSYTYTSTIADYVTGITFTYYSSTGEFIPAPGTYDDIIYIKIALNMQENVSVEVKVHLRNFRKYW